MHQLAYTVDLVTFSALDFSRICDLGIFHKVWNFLIILMIGRAIIIIIFENLSPAEIKTP